MKRYITRADYRDEAHGLRREVRQLRQWHREWHVAYWRVRGKLRIAEAEVKELQEQNVKLWRRLDHIKALAQ